MKAYLAKAGLKHADVLVLGGLSYSLKAYLAKAGLKLVGKLKPPREPCFESISSESRTETKERFGGGNDFVALKAYLAKAGLKPILVVVVSSGVVALKAYLAKAGLKR